MIEEGEGKTSGDDGTVEPAERETVAGTVAGTVAILGRPNVGKSTLLNKLVGEKLAIVTPKPQTTRNRIVGVWNGAGGQIVFVDTPGVHGAKKELNRFMVGEALGLIADVDAALLVVEAGDDQPGDPEREILRGLAAARRPVVLAVNKVDKVKDKTILLPRLAAWEKLGDFRAIVPLSALSGINVEPVARELCKLLPEGPPLYGPDTLTDRTERFLAAELVREQLFLRLRQEVPYAVAVVIEGWEERAGGDVVITASIVVERESQKAIVVGKGAAMIREIGTRARHEITDLLQRPAHLKLTVRVEPEWTTSPAALARLGYRA
jgi:GTP-binding protein Era